MITQEDARIRVARGAAMLDERRPGWFNDIDIDRLYLATCHQCMLGQLYRDFWVGIQQLWDPTANVEDLDQFSHAWMTARTHGFVLSDYEVRCANTLNTTPDGYALLKDAWVDAIAHRLAVQPQPVEVFAYV